MLYSFQNPNLDVGCVDCLRKADLRQMKILYVTPFNPLDKSCGGAIRSGKLWQELKKRGQVRTIVIPRSERIDTGAEEEYDVSFVDTRPVYSGRLPWFIYIAICGLIGMIMPGYDSKESIFRKLKITDGNFDLVVVRYLWCAAWCGTWKLGKCVVDVDDAPLDNFNTNIAQNYNWYIRPAVRLIFLRWQYLICRRVYGLWVSNGKDVRVLEKYNRNVSYLPNVSNAPTSAEYAPTGDAEFVMTVGNLSFTPNYVGIDRFLTLSWPSIHNAHKELKYLIAGKGAPKDFLDRWSRVEGVQVLGFVDSLEALYAKCLAVVVPLWEGGGTSVKTIEAIKYGCHVVATSVGVRGLSDNQIDQFDITVIRTNENFKSAIDRLVSMTATERLQGRIKIFASAKFLNSDTEITNSVDSVLLKALL